SELKNGEKREFIVADQYPVLLAKLDGRFFAVSSRCTHYGAPLEKGVLSASGCLTCPWHGACFNIKTGDIEDAPALDPLRSFPVHVEQDEVYIEADEEDLKANRGHPYSIPTCSGRPDQGTNANPSAPGVVIVGGGAGGLAAADALRQHHYTGPISILSQEPYAPIDRPKLSKVFAPPHSAIELRTAAQLVAMDVTVHEGVTVIGVDPQNKTVTFRRVVHVDLRDESDGEKLPYDSLLLATGGVPRTLAIPGMELGHVYTLRTLTDAQALATALRSRAQINLVIIGTSFIGLEYASVACQQGVHVTAIGVSDVPLKKVLGFEIGDALMSMHRRQGVEFKMNSSVDRLIADDIQADRVGGVQLKSGEVLPADMVLVAVGVKPNTEFLQTSDIRLTDNEGAIAVDQYLRIPQWPDIYAIGDIATHPYWLQPQLPAVHIEHWNVAQNMGRCAATNIAAKPQPATGGGGDGVPYRHVPYFWTVQYGKSIRYCGYAPDYDYVFIHGDVTEERWAAFYTKGDKVLAVASLNYDPIVSKCAQLFHDGQMPSISQIREGKN
ncbi:hypothetical protein BJ085DRAFT_10803, partial [Dimargaris cristalligena]